MTQPVLQVSTCVTENYLLCVHDSYMSVGL